MECGGCGEAVYALYDDSGTAEAPAIDGGNENTPHPVRATCPWCGFAAMLQLPQESRSLPPPGPSARNSVIGSGQVLQSLTAIQASLAASLGNIGLPAPLVSSLGGIVTALVESGARVEPVSESPATLYVGATDASRGAFYEDSRGRPTLPPSCWGFSTDEIMGLLRVYPDGLKDSEPESGREVGEADGTSSARHVENRELPTCSICLVGMTESTERPPSITAAVAQLFCGHYFHVMCIRAWVDAANYGCPVCRSPLITA